MSAPAPQAPSVPAGTGRSLASRIRCLAARIGKLVRTAHANSVPF